MSQVEVQTQSHDTVSPTHLHSTVMGLFPVLLCTALTDSAIWRMPEQSPGRPCSSHSVKWNWVTAKLATALSLPNADWVCKCVCVCTCVNVWVKVIISQFSYLVFSDFKFPDGKLLVLLLWLECHYQLPIMHRFIHCSRPVLTWGLLLPQTRKIANVHNMVNTMLRYDIWNVSCWFS